MTKEFVVDRLLVRQFATREEMGRAAAGAVREQLLETLARKKEANVLFAAAPSQNELLSALVAAPDVPWERVNAFHMDEYVGLAEDAPQGFGNFLRRSIFEKLPFRSVSYLRGGAEDLEAECRRYAAALQTHPLDVACAGIGENGHLAFNDPHVADIQDARAVKLVELDETCRLQQVHDGCFPSLEQVPSQALTLTIPAILRASAIVCVVPARTKALAVRTALREEITPHCPASALRLHKHAVLYIETESASLLEKEA